MEEGVLISEASLYISGQELQVWYLGRERVSCLERCPHFRGVLTKRFYLKPNMAVVTESVCMQNIFAVYLNMVRPIPRWAESSFFVNRSPISAMRALKQKKVSASACSERENRKNSECSFQGCFHLSI